MRTHFLLLVSVALGCASASSPDAVESSSSPTVVITQTSKVVNLQNASRDPLGVGTQSTAPVDYQLDVSNPYDHPLTLLSVEIETVGASGGYALKRVRHTFTREIAARSTAEIPLRAWVQPLQLTDSGQIASPVMIRGVAKFESKGSTLRTAFTARFQK